MGRMGVFLIIVVVFVFLIGMRKARDSMDYDSFKRLRYAFAIPVAFALILWLSLGH